MSSYTDMEQMMDSDLNTDTSQPSERNDRGLDNSLLISLSGSSSNNSYSSDQGSGNEDSRDSCSAIYEESSDEVEFLAT